jgi:hypothetical protein
MLEILPETTTGVQIGRTMIIFQTRASPLKDCEVGEYLRQRDEEGKKFIEIERKEKKDKRDAARKEYDDKKRLKKPINEIEEAKNLGL